jgi:hypothetical protein
MSFFSRFLNPETPESTQFTRDVAIWIIRSDWWYNAFGDTDDEAGISLMKAMGVWEAFAALARKNFGKLSVASYAAIATPNVVLALVKTGRVATNPHPNPDQGGPKFPRPQADIRADQARTKYLDAAIALLVQNTIWGGVFGGGANFYAVMDEMGAGASKRVLDLGYEAFSKNLSVEALVELWISEVFTDLFVLAQSDHKVQGPLARMEYRRDIERLILRLLPDNSEWKEPFNAPAADALLAECIDHTVPAKNAAVILLVTGFGTRTKDFGPAHPTKEYVTFYLTTLVALNKLLGAEEDIAVTDKGAGWVW